VTALVFNGVELPVRDDGAGRVAWDAKHLCKALGYGRERRIARMVVGEWSEDFVEGECLVPPGSSGGVS
jgi:hypothetical protein